MDPILELQHKMDALTKMFSSKMSAFEDSISTAKTPDVSSLASDFNTFKSLIWKTVSNLKSQLDIIFKYLDTLEMKSRSNILLLHGEPETANEDILDLSVNVCKNKLNICNFSRQAIITCMRLGKSAGTNKPRPILLRFVDQQSRGQVWSNKSKLKNSGLTLSEFLTSPRHQVFIEARKLFGVKSCWTCDGKIVILCPDGSRRKIVSLEELNAINSKPTSSPSASSSMGANAMSVDVLKVSKSRSGRVFNKNK